MGARYWTGARENQNQGSWVWDDNGAAVDMDGDTGVWHCGVRSVDWGREELNSGIRIGKLSHPFNMKYELILFLFYNNGMSCRTSFQ